MEKKTLKMNKQKEQKVRYLDDEHVRERVDLSALARILINVADTGKSVRTSHVHRTRSTDT